jgi:hypothetical protein
MNGDKRYNASGTVAQASSDKGTRIEIGPNLSNFAVFNAKELTKWHYYSFCSFEIGENAGDVTINYLSFHTHVLRAHARNKLLYCRFTENSSVRQGTFKSHVCSKTNVRVVAGRVTTNIRVQ